MDPEMSKSARQRTYWMVFASTFIVGAILLEFRRFNLAVSTARNLFLIAGVLIAVGIVWSHMETRLALSRQQAAPRVQILADMTLSATPESAMAGVLRCTAAAPRLYDLALRGAVVVSTWGQAVPARDLLPGTDPDEGAILVADRWPGRSGLALTARVLTAIDGSAVGREVPLSGEGPRVDATDGPALDISRRPTLVALRVEIVDGTIVIHDAVPMDLEYIGRKGMGAWRMYPELVKVHPSPRMTVRVTEDGEVRMVIAANPPESDRVLDEFTSYLRWNLTPRLVVAFRGSSAS